MHSSVVLVRSQFLRKGDRMQNKLLPRAGQHYVEMHLIVSTNISV